MSIPGLRDKPIEELIRLSKSKATMSDDDFRKELIYVRKFLYKLIHQFFFSWVYYKKQWQEFSQQMCRTLCPDSKE